jgi:AraC family transcriptional regulator
MTRGRAKLAISQGLSIWVLEVPDGFGEAGFHAHHAIQITIALSGELMLADEERKFAGRCVAVAADARHRIEGRGLIGFIFVEPESPLGRTLTARLFADAALAVIDDAAFLAAAAPLAGAFDGASRDDLLGIGEAAIACLVPLPDAIAPDPRIGRIIDHASTHPDQPLAETAAAAGVHLSPSRLRHLFVEQTGLAFKTYLLWRRLVRALDVYSQGRSLTEAAHAAGFADSAHFSRAFKRTFGAPATTLTRL